jgi:hypothetical protein
MLGEKLNFIADLINCGNDSEKIINLGYFDNFFIYNV